MRHLFIILAIFSAGFLTYCSSTDDSSQDDSQFQQFKEEIRRTLLGDQANLADRDLPEIQARTEATVDGKLDRKKYEQLLTQKRATVPNLRVEYRIIDAGFYESGDMWHANILAEKRIIIDGTDLSPEGWKVVRKTYSKSTAGGGTWIDDENQQVIMSNMEHYSAVRRDNHWVINPTRMVE